MTYFVWSVRSSEDLMKDYSEGWDLTVRRINPKSTTLDYMMNYSSYEITVKMKRMRIREKELKATYSCLNTLSSL